MYFRFVDNDADEDGDCYVTIACLWTADRHESRPVPVDVIAEVLCSWFIHINVASSRCVSIPLPLCVRFQCVPPPRSAHA